MKRNINKVAIIGSGIMGSSIACHFANIGVNVLLLDIVPTKLSNEEIEKGINEKDKIFRNKIVSSSLNKTIKSKPSPLYNKKFRERIEIGNLEDDIEKVETADWIIEVVIEKIEIKNTVFEKLDKYRKKGSLISSNTSGIPINSMIKNRSEDFCDNFCGTHFFNPPRYLKLLEIIPSEKTKPEVIDFLINYGEKFLGKTTISCKDTPAFIANRIGIANIASLFKIVNEMKLTVEETDFLTGPIIGIPKSATFRTCDLVGLDTVKHVANGIYENCPNDEIHKDFKLTEFVQSMIKKNLLGNKTGEGFYKKTKNQSGKKEILTLDLNTLEFRKKIKPKFNSIKNAKKETNLHKRIPLLINGNEKENIFYKKMFGSLFSYAANKIPEISNEIYKIDKAIVNGFGWEIGPYEIWDSIGFQNGLELIKNSKLTTPEWINKIDSKNNNFSFYKVLDGIQHYYDINTEKYNKIPGITNFIFLNNIRNQQTIWKNNGVNLIDIGDGILNLEFQTKMNSIGEDVINGITESISIAEKDYKGLVIGNQGAHFSAGADISMIFMLAAEQEYKDLNLAIHTFQQTTMALRYSNIPVVVATHGFTFGGGCELAMHADAVQSAAETYMGLVEIGVGLIPGGGGTKEMALRASDSYYSGDIELPKLKEAFLNIGMAKVSTSAHEAFDLGYLRKGFDEITINSNLLIKDAKLKAISLAERGYKKPTQKKDIKVLGKQGLGMFLVGADSMREGGYITDHEFLISKKLAHIICGGDLSYPTKVSEQYLLDLEREAFLSLCGEVKTLERIEHMLKTGKPLRN